MLYCGFHRLEQMVYAQPRICPGKWDTKTPRGFWHRNGSLNLGQTAIPYNNQQKKNRTCRIFPADHRVELKEIEKKDKYLHLCQGTEKTVEHESDDYTNCNWCSWYSPQMIATGTWGLGNNRTSGDCTNYSIVEIGQNTGKSPGDLERSVVTQGENYQLTLVWKKLSNK